MNTRLTPLFFSSIRCFLALAAMILGITLATAQPQPVAGTTLHSFGSGSDGSGPFSCLFLASDNSLYGSAPFGGTNGSGTLFKMNRDGTGYTVLHNFYIGDNEVVNYLTKPGPCLIRGRDGALYGATQGGTDYSGGVFFKLNTDGSGYTQLYVFTNEPTSLLQLADGALYGESLLGVFKIDTTGSNFTMLHTFNFTTEGRTAYGKLIQDSAGFLYGTAALGGSNSLGSLFKLDTNGITFTLLHTFGGTNDGAKPYAGVIEGEDGALYGTTYAGGTNNVGTVYKINRDGSGYQILHHFQTNGIDGELPYSGLMAGMNHLLYGTTSLGGTNAIGTIYEIGINGSNYQVVYTFNGPDGINPYSDLVQGPAFDGSGALYGLAKAGGAFGYGTLFGIVVNPPLAITPAVSPSGNNPVVTWPAWALNYTLQTSTNVNGPWTDNSNGVPVTGLQLTNTAPGGYYRLIWKQ